MDTSVFDRHHIYFNSEAQTQDEAFRAIAKAASACGFVKDEDTYYKGLWEREKEATTGFQDGIAIPHSKSDTCIRPGVFLMKFDHAIEWNALDGKPVHAAIALTIPCDGGEQHLRILSRIARKMINDDFRAAIINSTDREELFEVISAIEI